METSFFVSFYFLRITAWTYNVRSLCSTPSYSLFSSMEPPSNLMLEMPKTPIRVSLGARLHTSSTFS